MKIEMSIAINEVEYPIINNRFNKFKNFRGKMRRRRLLKRPKFIEFRKLVKKI